MLQLHSLRYAQKVQFKKKKKRESLTRPLKPSGTVNKNIRFNDLKNNFGANKLVENRF